MDFKDMKLLIDRQIVKSQRYQWYKKRFKNTKLEFEITFNNITNIKVSVLSDGTGGEGDPHTQIWLSQGMSCLPPRKKDIETRAKSTLRGMEMPRLLKIGSFESLKRVWGGERRLR